MQGNRNRNLNLDTSIAPTKAKLREPAYSQALYMFDPKRKLNTGKKQSFAQHPS